MASTCSTKFHIIVYNNCITPKRSSKAHKLDQMVLIYGPWNEEGIVFGVRFYKIA
jgi:hypothetical protein